MVDIQSVAAEIRRGKKKRRRQKNIEDRKKLQGKNIMAPLLHRAAITNDRMKIYIWPAVLHRAAINKHSSEK